MTPGRLLPYRFTLTVNGGLLSVALSESHLSWALPSVLPYRARTFLSGKNPAAATCPTPQEKSLTFSLLFAIRNWLYIIIGHRKMFIPKDKALTIRTAQNLLTTLQF